MPHGIIYIAQCQTRPGFLMLGSTAAFKDKNILPTNIAVEQEIWQIKCRFNVTDLLNAERNAHTEFGQRGYRIPRQKGLYIINPEAAASICQGIVARERLAREITPLSRQAELKSDMLLEAA